MVTRGFKVPRTCPVGTCQRIVRDGYLMCGVHWRRVPQDVQRAVWRTWRRFQATSGDEDWTAYSEAREQALASVRPSVGPGE